MFKLISVAATGSRAPVPLLQALALGARSQRKNGGVTIHGPEIAAVTKAIGSGEGGRGLATLLRGSFRKKAGVLLSKRKEKPSLTLFRLLRLIF